MKKIVCFSIFLFFSFLLVVDASDYNTGDLISIDDVASVNTEKFYYRNFNYSLDNNYVIKFEGIKNNTYSKIPVSVNILLFDANKKNIGFLTYCSDKDYSSDYNGFHLLGNQESSYVINVSPKYLFGNDPANVSYFSILDENKYCQIGGYDKYKGKTIEQILGNEEVKSKDVIFSIVSKYLYIVIIVLGVFLLLIILKFILSFVISKLKNRKPKEKNVSGSVDDNVEEQIIDLDYDDVNSSSDNNTDTDDLFDDVSVGGVLEDDLDDSFDLKDDE